MTRPVTKKSISPRIIVRETRASILSSMQASRPFACSLATATAWLRPWISGTALLGLIAGSLCSQEVGSPASAGERPLLDSEPRRLPWGLGTLFTQELQASSEVMTTGDFLLTEHHVRYGQVRERGRWNVDLSTASFNLDLTSPDPFFTATSVKEDRNAVAIAGDYSAGGRLRWDWGGSYYDGFSDYRSVWFHEYYRQLGSLPFLGGYPEVSPKGFALNPGLRWEYWRNSGFLDVDVGYYRDWIIPSAEFEAVTILGPEVLNSYAVGLSTENVLSRRLRSKVQLQLVDTDARDLRAAGQFGLNVALGDRGVWRWQAGGVHEAPDFEAVYAGSTLEWSVVPGWLLSVNGRVYDDSGEIQDSLPATNAAPGLTSYQVSVASRFIWEDSALRLQVGPYWTRYDSMANDAPFFEDLYSSRDWWLIQLAYSLEF